MPNWFRHGAIRLVVMIAALSDISRGNEPLPERVEFNRDVRPILSDHCFQCHGPDAAQRKSELRFDTETGALVDLGNDRRAIVAGKPDQSELVSRIISTDADAKMPPPEFERPLSAQQISILSRWIEQGAKWEKHWSFVNPVKVVPPILKLGEWSRSAVDSFVLAKLEREGLTGAGEANRSTLLRRITFDLTGLPPSLDEISSFQADESPDSYERVVDRLLASPRYGERMAIRWLNGARYADTSGYQSDGERTMWRWRDWVIDAFNQNLPFDQFTIEQLAGDLLHGATLNQRIATGFNRNHRGNAEGGIIPEEYAVEYVVDRVETTSTVWLGLTTMCARCHNHKFDPITQTEFYQFYAFFNNIPEKGRSVKFGNSPPYLISPTDDQLKQLTAFDARLASAEALWNANQEQIAESQSAWERQSVPSLPAVDSVRHQLILHVPLDGDAAAAFSAPISIMRPDGYLGQARLLTPSLPDRASVPQENGQPNFSAGRFGHAFEGDGQHYAVVGDVANFGFFDKFSVSAWIRQNNKTGGTIISRMTDVLHGDGWCLVLDQGKLQVHLTKRWLDDACRVETADAIDTSDWRQITMTYDGRREASGIQIYVDGVLQRTVTLLDELNQSFDNKGPLRIGAGNGPESRFHGLIDEVRIFDRILTNDEAQILAVPETLSSIAVTPVEKRSARQRLALREYFVQFAAQESIRQSWSELRDLRDKRLKFIEQLPTTMVMEELPTPRDAFVLIRGEYDKHGEKVDCGCAVKPDSTSIERSAESIGTRPMAG